MGDVYMRHLQKYIQGVHHIKLSVTVIDARSVKCLGGLVAKGAGCYCYSQGHEHSGQTPVVLYCTVLWHSICTPGTQAHARCFPISEF
jgi:hypothetical protein